MFAFIIMIEYCVPKGLEVVGYFFFYGYLVPTELKCKFKTMV